MLSNFSAADRRRPPRSSSDPSGGGGVAMTGRRLLVVDDNRAFGEFVSEVASEAGFEVEVTTDGRAFKNRYRAYPPSIVIIELVMPEIDGVELVQWVAAHKAPARVIVMTAHSPKYATLAKLLGEGRGLATVTTLDKPAEAAGLRRALAEAESAALDEDPRCHQDQCKRYV